MKEKLLINKRLPYIKLPKDKIDLFIKWYNNDLRTLEELPEVFKEGYIEIDTSDFIYINIPSIFDVKDEANYRNIIEMHNKVKLTYSKMILHFNLINNNIIELEGCYGDGEYAFKQEFNLKEDELIKKMKESILQMASKDQDYQYKNLPELETKLKLDLRSKEFDVLKERQNEFNRKLGNTCVGLVISVIWYLATNTSEKYLVSNTKVVESHQNINTNKHHKHHNRTITAPIYYLVDKKPITVDKLIKKRNGWTISHSFQVRGHYRHYKNGKTIFIKSYEKGKELDNFQNSVITVSPDY